MSSNKQNTIPNETKGLFSNTLVSAKMTCKQEKSGIKEIINIQFQKKQMSTVQCSVCHKHSKSYSNMFCSECLTYSLCRHCIQSSHANHEVMQFNSIDQMLTQTKQILLQNLEETLKDLKSKQNDVKNRNLEINLIRNSLRTLEQQVVGVISGLFREIQGQLLPSLEKYQNQFNDETDRFFSQLNQTNDQLRDNLMKILDSQIEPLKFNKLMICKQAPATPNFAGYKNTLEKFKKVLKDVKNQLQTTKKLMTEGCNSLAGNANKGSSTATMSKFDRYIESSNQRGEKVNQSFLKTLKLIQSGNDKQNMVLNTARSQNRLSKKVF